MDTRLVGGKYDEKYDICIVSKYLPKVFTSQRDERRDCNLVAQKPDLQHPNHVMRGSSTSEDTSASCAS